MIQGLVLTECKLDKMLLIIIFKCVM